jgi:site-specific recombinase XerD
MKKLKHKEASIRLNNTSIVIYYSYQNEEMRFPTGVKINVSKSKSGKYFYWDPVLKKLKLPPFFTTDKDKVAIIISQQTTIDTLLRKANEIITEYFQRNIIITPNELKILLSQQQDEKISIANADFFDCLTNFLELKRNHFSARGNIISLKDYTSTKLLLLDYQAYLKAPIRVSAISKLWLDGFVQYMSTPHPKYIGDHKVSSKGGMANSTIKKRLDIFAEFFGYLKELKLVTEHEVDLIKKFKKTIRKESTHKETLEISEIHQLYKFNFPLPHHRQIRDLFVFICLTGIRYQDLVDFDKRFIQNSKKGDGKIYKKAASKTGIDYNVPLCNLAIKILEKYNYQLPKVSDAHGNRMIKEALQETKLFDEYTQIVDKETNEYKKRYEAITLHKGRNTFITNLVDSTPLNELMKYTGHKKLSTLQGYIDTKRPVKMDYIKIFDL